MTAINTIEDLVRIMDERPEWVEAMRVRLLTREVLELPQTIAKLAETVEKFIDSTNKRLDSIEARLDQHDARFDAVDARFDAVDARFDQVDARFDAVDARFDAVHQVPQSIIAFRSCEMTSRPSKPRTPEMPRLMTPSPSPATWG